MNFEARSSHPSAYDQHTTLVLMPDGRQVSLASLRGFQVAPITGSPSKHKDLGVNSDSLDGDKAASASLPSSGGKLLRGLRAASKMAKKVAEGLAPSSDQHMLTYEMALRYGMLEEGTAVNKTQLNNDKMQASPANTEQEVPCPVSVWTTDAAQRAARF